MGERRRRPWTNAAAAMCERCATPSPRSLAAPQRRPRSALSCLRAVQTRGGRSGVVASASLGRQMVDTSLPLKYRTAPRPR